jgi:hypothetical protein
VRSQIAHTRGFRAILRDILKSKDWLVDDAVRCEALSLSTCQPVDTLAAVDAAQVTIEAQNANGVIFRAGRLDHLHLRSDG